MIDVIIYLASMMLVLFLTTRNNLGGKINFDEFVYTQDEINKIKDGNNSNG